MSTLQPNFDKNPKVQGAIDTLYKSLVAEDYGSTFEWEELKERTGIPNMSQERLYYVCLRVNDLLLQDAKYLTTVHGHGKQILNPSDHAIEARKKIKSSVRIYRKAGNILAATNMDMLDEQQKLQVVEEANKWSTLEHIHTALLKKKQAQVKDKSESQKMIFDLITYLKN